MLPDSSSPCEEAGTPDYCPRGMHMTSSNMTSLTRKYALRVIIILSSLVSIVKFKAYCVLHLLLSFRHIFYLGTSGWYIFDQTLSRFFRMRGWPARLYLSLYLDLLSSAICPPQPGYEANKICNSYLHRSEDESVY